MNSLLITGGTLWTGRTFVRGYALHIEGERIAAVGPEEEVRAGTELLRALGLRRGVQFISCPTCGRCRVDLGPLVEAAQAALSGVTAPLVVAVMHSGGAVALLFVLVTLLARLRAPE